MNCFCKGNDLKICHIVLFWEQNQRKFFFKKLKWLRKRKERFIQRLEGQVPFYIKPFFTNAIAWMTSDASLPFSRRVWRELIPKKRDSKFKIKLRNIVNSVDPRVLDYDRRFEPKWVRVDLQMNSPFIKRRVGGVKGGHRGRKRRIRRVKRSTKWLYRRNNRIRPGVNMYAYEPFEEYEKKKHKLKKMRERRKGNIVKLRTVSQQRDEVLTKGELMPANLRKKTKVNYVIEKNEGETKR